MQAIEHDLRVWLSEKFAPYVAVLSTASVKEFLQDNANLSPAELLRPFCRINSLNGKYVQTVEKAVPFKQTNFQLKTIDAHKIDGQIYKSSEYNNLFKYIMDIESPKESLQYDLILKLSHGEMQPLKNAQADLDAYLEAKKMRNNLTPWFSMWKKWFLDKTRFKDHELLD